MGLFGTKIKDELLVQIYALLIQAQKELDEAKKQKAAEDKISFKIRGMSTDAAWANYNESCKSAFQALQGKLTKVIAEMETGKWTWKRYGKNMDVELRQRIEEEMRKKIHPEDSD